jgi:hypothetical protein
MFITESQLEQQGWKSVVTLLTDFEKEPRFLPPGAGVAHQLAAKLEKEGIPGLFLTF